MSLTDGREYMIDGPSIVFGREASCDIVIPQKRVSRRHTEILATSKGYVVADLSSNGTFVNGERIAGQRLLARADVVRVGDHEFRFYADVATDPEPRTTKPTRGAPAGAEYRLGDTLHGIPADLGPPTPGSVAAAPPQPAAPTRPTAPAQATAPAQPTAPTRPTAPAQPAAPPPPAASPLRGAPAGAQSRLGDTLHRVPAAPPPPPPPAPAAPPQGTAPAAPPSPVPPSRQPPAAAAAPTAPASPGPARGLLANLIVRKGQLKGHRFPIRVPIVNVGRAEYNDVVVPDSSVSSAHAKVQLREGIWVVVDLDSTNGTFLDGDRVSGEAPIAPGAVIRFGEVSVVFESTKDDTAQKGGGTEVLGVIIPPKEQA